MMKATLAVIGTLSCLVSLNAFGFYCSTPNGSGYINIGDSIDAVTAACGAATSSAPSTSTNNAITTVQYWMYSNAKVENSQFASTTNSTKVTQMSPPQVFQVTNNKVTNITQSSQSVNQANCQQGGLVRVGDSADQLMENCGKPTSVNTEQSTGQGNGSNNNQGSTGDNSNDQSQNVVWTYDMGTGQAPLTLEFQNGQLKSINGGS